MFEKRRSQIYILDNVKRISELKFHREQSRKENTQKQYQYQNNNIGIRESIIEKKIKTRIVNLNKVKSQQN